MTELLTDPDREARSIADRRAWGADRHDEVWDGVYVMAPMANDEHQHLVTRLAYIFEAVIGVPGLGLVRAGVNVSDQRDDWTRNYRVPDVAIFLPGHRAENRGTHWVGGPDFAVEILSPGDRSREKVAFYEAVGVRELLLLDRKPWSIELYRLIDGQLSLVGRSTVEAPAPLVSEMVPLTFGLEAGEDRPRVVVAAADGRQWTF